MVSAAGSDLNFDVWTFPTAGASSQPSSDLWEGTKVAWKARDAHTFDDVERRAAGRSGRAGACRSVTAQLGSTPTTQQGDMSVSAATTTLSAPVGHVADSDIERFRFGISCVNGNESVAIAVPKKNCIGNVFGWASHDCSVGGVSMRLPLYAAGLTATSEGLGTRSGSIEYAGSAADPRRPYLLRRKTDWELQTSFALPFLCGALGATPRFDVAYGKQATFTSARSCEETRIALSGGGLSTSQGDRIQPPDKTKPEKFEPYDELSKSSTFTVYRALIGMVPWMGIAAGKQRITQESRTENIRRVVPPPGTSGPCIEIERTLATLLGERKSLAMALGAQNGKSHFYLPVSFNTVRFDISKPGARKAYLKALKGKGSAGEEMQSKLPTYEPAPVGQTPLSMLLDGRKTPESALLAECEDKAARLPDGAVISCYGQKYAKQRRTGKLWRIAFFPSRIMERLGTTLWAKEEIGNVEEVIKVKLDDESKDKQPVHGGDKPRYKATLTRTCGKEFPRENSFTGRSNQTVKISSRWLQLPQERRRFADTMLRASIHSAALESNRLEKQLVQSLECATDQRLSRLLVHGERQSFGLQTEISAEELRRTATKRPTPWQLQRIYLATGIPPRRMEAISAELRDAYSRRRGLSMEGAMQENIQTLERVLDEYGEPGLGAIMGITDKAMSMNADYDTNESQSLLMQCQRFCLLNHVSLQAHTPVGSVIKRCAEVNEMLARCKAHETVLSTGNLLYEEHIDELRAGLNEVAKQLRKTLMVEDEVRNALLSRLYAQKRSPGVWLAIAALSPPYVLQRVDALSEVAFEKSGASRFATWQQAHQALEDLKMLQAMSLRPGVLEAGDFWKFVSQSMRVREKIEQTLIETARDGSWWELWKSLPWGWLFRAHGWHLIWWRVWGSPPSPSQIVRAVKKSYM